MARYDCYFLGANGKVLVTEEIEARSDADALTQARRKFTALAMFPRFELRCDERPIHSEARTPQPA
jgi:hypothetical protein